MSSLGNGLQEGLGWVPKADGAGVLLPLSLAPVFGGTETNLDKDFGGKGASLQAPQ